MGLDAVAFFLSFGEEADTVADTHSQKEKQNSQENRDDID